MSADTNAKSPIMQEVRGTELPDRALALWFLGQEGFIVKWSGITVMFDPYLSNTVNAEAGNPWVRAFDAPVSPADCSGIDFVVCSHHHSDHMDPATLREIAKFADTRFIVPKAHLPLLREWGIAEHRLIGMSHGEKRKLADGFALEAHAAMHEQFEQDEAGEHLFLSFVASFGESLKLLHAGDTIGFAGLADWLKPQGVDIALLPINGRDFVRQGQGIVGNMNYREAADLGVLIGAKLLVPMHFGMFHHNDENPAYFVDYLYRHYPRQPFHMFTPGERFIYMK